MSVFGITRGYRRTLVGVAAVFALLASGMPAATAAESAPTADTTVATVNGKGSYETIAAAVEAASAGDTVTIVSAGTDSCNYADGENGKDNQKPCILNKIGTDYTVTVDKKLNFTAEKTAAPIWGTLKFTENASESTVTGLKFVVVDGNHPSNIDIDGADDVTVSDNDFMLKHDVNYVSGADTQIDKQIRSVFVRGGSDRTRIEGNRFEAYLTSKKPSATAGIGVFGTPNTPIEGTIITGNKFTSKKVPSSNAYSSVYFVTTGNVDSKNETDVVKNMQITDNQVINGTGTADGTSATYGIGLGATTNAVISKNEFAGLVAVSAPIDAKMGINNSLAVTENKINSFIGVDLTAEMKDQSVKNYLGEGDQGLTYDNNELGEGVRSEFTPDSSAGNAGDSTNVKKFITAKDFTVVVTKGSADLESDDVIGENYANAKLNVNRGYDLSVTDETLVALNTAIGKTVAALESGAHQAEQKVTVAIVATKTPTTPAPSPIADGTVAQYEATKDVVATIPAVNVPAPSPSSPWVSRIEVTSKPSKTEYGIGDEFDAGGMVVSRVWSDGSKDKLSADQYTVTGFDSSKPGTVKVTVTLKSDASKTVTFEVTVKARDLEVHRLYKHSTGEHFYTANVAEYEHLMTLGVWRDEGVAFVMSDWGTEVDRFYNKGIDKHMYTTNKVESDSLDRNGWRSEGVGFRVPEGASTKVWRLYNTSNGDHLFTTNWLEYTLLRILPAWRGEDVAFMAK